jgi:hypothetical protein
VKLVWRSKAGLFPKELKDPRIEVGAGAQELLEVGLEKGANLGRWEIEGRQPVAAGEANAALRLEFDRNTMNIEALFLEKAAEPANGSLGGCEVEGATEKEALPFVIGHNDKIGVIGLIQPETRKDSDGLFFSFVLPFEGLKQRFHGIQSGRRGGLHDAILP